MHTVPDPSAFDDSPLPTGFPDELAPSMAAFLDEVYATAEDLNESELEELAARDAELRLSAEISRAIADTRRLSAQLADLGFPARIAV